MGCLLCFELLCFKWIVSDHSLHLQISPKQTVEQVCWYTKENTDLSQSEHFKNRIQYLGDTKNNCTLRINGLTESDAKEKYKFWFKTNKDRYAGAAVTLIITGNLHFIKL